MFLFTSEILLDVPRVMVFTVRERGREEGPQAFAGEGTKNRGQIRKQKAECKILPRERGFLFFFSRQEKEKEKMWDGGRKEEMSK